MSIFDKSKNTSWEEESKSFFNKKSRDRLEFEWKLHGNSVHPSVYFPHFYPDYYKSFDEWLKGMKRSHYSIPTLNKLKKDGFLDE